MALNDHRLFRCEDHWWVAFVIGGSSAVKTGGTPQLSANERETVTFTCLTDEETHSRHKGIPATFLNRLSHSMICSLLQAAKPLGDRFEIQSSNVPEETELGPKLTRDDEGLRWGTRRHRRVVVIAANPELSPSFELVCLDDSALHMEIALPSDADRNRFLGEQSEDGLRSLIQLVKTTYIDRLPKIREIHVHCRHCDQWIPSPMPAGSDAGFDARTLIGNQLECPNCMQWSGCNKENMRVRYEDSEEAPSH